MLADGLGHGGAVGLAATVGGTLNAEFMREHADAIRKVLGATGLGWITRDFTSATLASSENIFKPSIKRNASSLPPLISNVKIEPPPLGKYFL